MALGLGALWWAPVGGVVQQPDEVFFRLGSVREWIVGAEERGNVVDEREVEDASAEGLGKGGLKLGEAFDLASGAIGGGFLVALFGLADEAGICVHDDEMKGGRVDASLRWKIEMGPKTSGKNQGGFIYSRRTRQVRLSDSASCEENMVSGCGCGVGKGGGSRREVMADPACCKLPGTGTWLLGQ